MFNLCLEELAAAPLQQTHEDSFEKARRREPHKASILSNSRLRGSIKTPIVDRSATTVAASIAFAQRSELVAISTVRGSLRSYNLFLHILQSHCTTFLFKAVRTFGRESRAAMMSVGDHSHLSRLRGRWTQPPHYC